MSKDIKCRKWTLKSHFSGLPKREDLEIVEEQLPELKDGGKWKKEPLQAECSKHNLVMLLYPFNACRQDCVDAPP